MLKSLRFFYYADGAFGMSTTCSVADADIYTLMSPHGDLHWFSESFEEGVFRCLYIHMYICVYASKFKLG